jgi:AcrR family transcriptional regulator
VPADIGGGADEATLEDVAVKTRILEAATELIASSPDADVSTRAVCDAAGISPPALYHHFGDKDGLLRAVVDHGWTRFLESKHKASARNRHLADEIRAGWGNHLQFARENPSLYKLMWSPALSGTSQAAREAHQMLYDMLEGAAARGELRVSVKTAAQIVLAASSGAALSLVSQPELFDDDTFANQLRDAIIAAIAVDADGPKTSKRSGAGATLASTAATLQGKLSTEPNPLTAPERALMQQWLARLADSQPVPPPVPRRRQLKQGH